jgi:DNA-binding response OmpR family regulator
MDGEQALRILGSGFSPALIMLDLNFPGVSGLTLLERTAPPVVVFSSSYNVDELSRAIALGDRDCIRKPMDIAAYFEAVQVSLKSGRSGPLERRNAKGCTLCKVGTRKNRRSAPADSTFVQSGKCAGAVGRALRTHPQFRTLPHPPQLQRGLELQGRRLHPPPPLPDPLV